MRAKEFTINIPINIKMDDDQPQIVAAQPAAATQPAAAPQPTQEPVDDNVGTFIPPLQQKIELLKKSAGVKSEFDPVDNETANAENKTIPNQVASDDEPLE
jgi:hypothetical protein